MLADAAGLRAMNDTPILDGLGGLGDLLALDALAAQATGLSEPNPRVAALGIDARRQRGRCAGSRIGLPFEIVDGPAILLHASQPAAGVERDLGGARHRDIGSRACGPGRHQNEHRSGQAGNKDTQNAQPQIGQSKKQK